MGQTTPTIRFFIADANLFFRRGLQALIEQSAGLCLVGEAGSAEELSRNLQAVQPDVLVIDGSLLGSQDASFLRVAVRQACPSTQILVLATKDSEHTLRAALTVGTRGYMLKDSKPRDLMAALFSTAFQDDEAYSSGMIPDLKALANHVRETGATQALTHREREVVSLLAEGKTVRTVASDLALSTKTIEAHKLNLMRKLDIHDRASLIAYASRNGTVGSGMNGRCLSGRVEGWHRNLYRYSSIILQLS